MAAYLDSERLIDLIIALVTFEALLLVALRAFFGRGPACASSIANCAAGAGLLLALRAAMTDAPFTVIAACLLGALVAHVADLRARWRVPPRVDGALGRAKSSSAALAPESSRV
ncbi:hypothetical protein [Roseiarcus sp.]|uniref:hypothetical protein n=1 Tax=Roseiarcus sp. TaxID=1969460 RepID=UPI003F9AE0A0